MKSWFSCLFLLLTFLVYFQSTTAYPSSSYAQRQRGYLLCQLSAVSCKRSLSTEDSSESNIDQYLQMCLALNKPLRSCLDQPLYDKRNILI